MPSRRSLASHRSSLRRHRRIRRQTLRVEALESRRVLAPLGVFADDGSDRLFVFDPSTREVSGWVNIPDGPGSSSTSPLKGDVEISRDGATAYITDFQNNVWVVDLQANPPTLASGTNPIRISNYGEDLQITSDQRYLVITNGNGPAQDGFRGAPISLVDTLTRNEVDTRILGNSTPNAVIVTDTNTILAARFDANRIHKLQLTGSGQFHDASQELEVIGPRNLVVHPNNRHVVALGSNATAETEVLTSIDIESFAVINSRASSSSGPVSAAGVFSHDGTQLFTRVGSRDGSIGRLQAYQFDPNTGVLGERLYDVPAATARLYYGVDQLALSLDGTRLYVPNNLDDRIDVHLAATGQWIESFTGDGVQSPTGIRVIDTNQTPLANAGGPYAIAVGQEIRLDASASSDADDDFESLSFHWDLDNDGIFGETGDLALRGDEVGAQPTFRSLGIAAGRTATINLRVTDPRGLTSTANAIIEVGYAPDLTLRSTDIQFTPSDPIPGEEVVLTARIRNVGLRPASNLQVRLLDFDNPVSSLLIDHLEAGGSRLVEFPPLTFEESFRLLTVKIDPLDEIDELEERNNESSVVLKIGNPNLETGDASIVLTMNDTFGGPASSAIVVGGIADYDFVNISGNRDHPVQGASVRVRVLDPATLQPISQFSGTYTDIEGRFRQSILTPSEIGVYPLQIEITDGTLTDSAIVELHVSTPPTQTTPLPSRPTPLPPRDGSTPSGGSPHAVPVDSQGTSDPSDLFVFSEDIVVSKQPGEVGESVSVGAFVQFFGPEGVNDVLINLNDQFAVDGKWESLTIASAVVDLPPAPVDFPAFIAIAAPWTNTQGGAHLIQAEIIDDLARVDSGPFLTQYSGNDQATKLVYVGVAPEFLSLSHTVELLVDADGNSVPTPGDTLRYLSTIVNNGTETLTASSLTAQFDQRLYQSTAPASSVTTVTANQATLSVGSLAPGATATMAVDVMLSTADEFPAGFVTMRSDVLFESFESVPVAATSELLVVGDIVAPDLQSSVVSTNEPAIEAEPSVDGWYGQLLTVLLAASDPSPGSGMDRLEYSLDGGSWTNAIGSTASVALTSEGVHTLRSRAFDGAGNVTQSALELKLDLSPPELLKPLDFQILEGDSIAIDSTWFDDNLAGLDSIKVDRDGDGSFETDVPVTLDGFDGPMVARPRIRAVDDVGNSVEYELVIQVQNRPPVLTMASTDQSVQAGNPIAPFRFTVDDVTTDTVQVTASIAKAGDPFEPLTPATGLNLVEVQPIDSSGRSVWQLEGIAQLASGAYTVRIEATDDDSGMATAEVQLTVTSELLVTDVELNRGAEQRSNVTEVAITFNQSTNIEELISLGRIQEAVQIVGTSRDLSVRELSEQNYRYDSANDQLIIDFTSDGFGGSEVSDLSDDRYELRLRTDMILSNLNLSLSDTDGLIDGMFRFDFHQLKGDYNGDASVGIEDQAAWFNRSLVRFNAINGDAGFNSAFDHDGDGRITSRDYYFWLRGTVGNSI